MEVKSSTKEKSLPADGARLSSIIDRLNGQNGLQSSSCKSAVCTVGFTCQPSRRSTRSNHQTPFMARWKQKGLECKMHECDVDKKVDIYAAGSDLYSEQTMGPELFKNMKPEKQLLVEECTTEKQSMKIDNLPGYEIRTMDSTFPKKIKFSLKGHNPRADAKPVVCLCKPTNSFSQRSSPEFLMESKQDSCSSMDNDLSEKNNVDQKSNESSFSFHACKDSTTPPVFSGRTRNSSGMSCICGICLQQFPSAFLLEKHQRESKHHLCSGCGQDFNDRAIFEEHVLNKKCKMRICCICRTNFVLGRNLKEAKSDRRSRCPECQKLFENAVNVSSAEKEGACRGSDPYHCMECGKTFLVLSRYKTHMMAAHTGERPFVCPECGKGFARMYALTTHIKYTHSDEKKFKCEFCPKSFKRKDHLKSHEVIHSSQKPHSCEVCGQGFNQKISLRKHLPCYNTKPTKTKATEDTADQTISEKKSSERWRSSEISESRVISENCAEPNCAIPRNATKEYLGCRCPPSCACKQFTIAVNVSCENSENSSTNFREIGTLPCCCDFELDKAVSRTTDDI